MLRYSFVGTVTCICIFLLGGCAPSVSSQGGIVATPVQIAVQKSVETSTDAPTATANAAQIPSDTASPTGTKPPTSTFTPTVTHTATHTGTPTRTNTPTITPTPTVPPDMQVLVTDHFAQPCLLGRSDAVRYARRCEAGEYLMLFIGDSSSTAAALYKTAPLTDVMVEVDARSVEGQPSSLYGIMVRADRNLDTFYMFGTRPNGTFVFDQYDRVTGWRNKAADPRSAAIKQGTATNRLKMLAQGNQVAVFVNDQWLNTFPAGDLKVGQVGLIGWGTKTRVSFSNLTITKVNKPRVMQAPRTFPTAVRVAATRQPQPTQPPVAQNRCQLQPGQAGILLINTRDFKVLLTIGGGDWGTHDYWFDPNSTTAIQFPPGNYTATLTLPGQGNYHFANDRIAFEAGSCTSLRTP